MAIDPIKALLEYVSYPSVSTDPAYHAGMEGARNFVVGQLSGLGFKVEIIETPLHPIVLASRIGNPEWPHVMFYAHYDVQPADPLDLWETEPFKPEVRNGRLYGRGATDNKGPFIVQLAALARVIERDPDIPLNFTFLVEGEEEMGSPSFGEFLKKYKDRLKEADVLLVSDTGSASIEQVIITTSLRGLVDLEIEVCGPKVDLHSGLYGGPVHNPIQALTEICASLHSADGRVNVPGFYDDVALPEEWEREELKKHPESDEDLKNFLGVPELYPPKGYTASESSKFAPTLEFNGIGGGYQGHGSKTIIPAKSFVKITCRLVANQTVDDIRTKVTKAIESRIPKGVNVKVIRRDGGEPYLVIPPHRSNSPKPYSEMLERLFDITEESVSTIFGNPPLYLRSGGSIPIMGDIKKATGLDPVMIGFCLGEDGMHAPNESFNLEMMERGISLYENILENLACQKSNEDC